MPTVTQFTPADVSAIKAGGTQVQRAPRPLYLAVQPAPFEILSDGKTFSGKIGDGVLYDPVTGSLWLVTANRLADYQPYTSPVAPAAPTTSAA